MKALTPRIKKVSRAMGIALEDVRVGHGTGGGDCDRRLRLPFVLCLVIAFSLSFAKLNLRWPLHAH